MEEVLGVISIDFLKDDGTQIGLQYGLIINYYDQTIIFSPFNINKNHFSHAKHAICMINNSIIKLGASRLSYPFLLRVWVLSENISINPAGDLTINCPKKNHSIYGSDNKIDGIEDININFWHATLPPFFAHAINKKYPIGKITYFNNKPTGIIVSHINNKSIIVNVFTLKQIAAGYDFNYAGLYYKLKMSERKQIYVAEDWYQYDNCLKKDDILLEIEDTIVGKEMYYPKLSRDLFIDTWITHMFIDKDNEELECKIIRDGELIKINIPRKPLSNFMQIPYYSTDEDKITFETIHVKNDIERYHIAGYDLLKCPRKLFI
jgi:hypothetical protein